MLQFQSDGLSNFLDGNYADMGRKRTDPRTMSKEMKHVQVQENREEEFFPRMFKRSLNQAAGKSKPEEHPLGYMEDLNNVTTTRWKGATRRDWAGETPTFQDAIRVRFETRFDWQCPANPYRGERCCPVLWN